MKVADIQKQQGISPSQDKTKLRDLPEVQSFGRILECEMEGETREGAGGVQSVGRDQPLTFDAGAQAVSREPSLDRRAYDAVAAGIEKLEELGITLGKDNASPKSLDELMRDLSGAMEGIQESLDGLPGEHPLRAIADELSILAYVESMKWNRGDYL